MPRRRAARRSRAPLQPVQAFYARDVLGDANYFTVLRVVSVGAMFVVAPFIPRIVETTGKKRVYIGAGVVCVVGVVCVIGAVGIALSPPSVPAVAIVCFAVYGIGLAAVNILMWALEADTVEYGEWRTGVRTEGTTYAAFSFTRKLGQAVGGAVAAYAIGLGGYVAGAELQSQGAVDAIRYAAGFVPAVFVLIAILIMIRYSLTESAFATMVAEVGERRTAAREGDGGQGERHA